jgi:hypothetical protein
MMVLYAMGSCSVYVRTAVQAAKHLAAATRVILCRTAEVEVAAMVLLGSTGHASHVCCVSLTAIVAAVLAVWLAVQLRLDAKIPGTVLLRDKNGGVFYITVDNVQQVSKPQQL